MSKKSSATRASYDAIAERFRERTADRARLGPQLDRFAAELAPGALVLDVGAGPGADSAELRRRGLRVVSLDLSLGMLRSGVREHPGPRVQADMRALPFRAAFAGLWVNASLLHLERAHVPPALRELRRVTLAPGLLYVAVKTGRDDGWETRRYGSEHPRWFTYWAPEAFDRVLAGAGFRVLEGETRASEHDTWLMRLCRAQADPDGS